MTSLRIPFISSVLILLFLAITSSVLSAEGQTEEALLSVVYIDVGQGDATLIESPTGIQVLIDGGKNSLVLRELSKQMGFFDRDIDMILMTHPDLDHVGGLIDVLRKYNVSTIVMTENENDTPAVSVLKKAIQNEGAEIIFARKGQVFDLGNGAQGSTTLSVLFPDRDPTYLESNTSSIISQLRYGESEFIFTGDSPTSIEEYLVQTEGSGLKSDVLKVGHHGSKTSTVDTFVSAVSPALAIISAGRDNSYGHPHVEVTDRLARFGIQYKNTADEGSIRLVSDGEKIWLK